MTDQDRLDFWSTVRRALLMVRSAAQRHYTDEAMRFVCLLTTAGAEYVSKRYLVVKSSN